MKFDRAQHPKSVIRNSNYLRCFGLSILNIKILDRLIYKFHFNFFPKATSEGFLLCTSSAGAELFFPGECRGVAGELPVYRNLTFS